MHNKKLMSSYGQFVFMDFYHYEQYMNKVHGMTLWKKKKKTGYEIWLPFHEPSWKFFHALTFRRAEY